MKESESFGVEEGYGSKVVEWVNKEAQKQGLKIEARLYGYKLTIYNSFFIIKMVFGLKFAEKAESGVFTIIGLRYSACLCHFVKNKNSDFAKSQFFSLYSKARGQFLNMC